MSIWSSPFVDMVCGAAGAVEPKGVLMSSTPGDTAGSKLALTAPHLVAASIIVPVLARRASA
jgi:hypothetical protein